MKKIILSTVLTLIFSTQVFAEPVMFNVESQKMHKISCSSAKKCTVNCIKIERKEAVKRGGVPCKRCGG